MMSELQSHTAGIVHFAAIREEIETVRLPLTDQDTLRTGRLPACLVTVLEGRIGADGVLPCVDLGLESDKGRSCEAGARWAPAFWRKPGVVDAALDILLQNIVDPVVWVMGEYVSSEFYELTHRGLLPEGVQLPSPPRGKLEVATLILRVTKPSEVFVTCEQGFGHWTGVRIVAFPMSREPVQMYEEWLASTREGRLCRSHKLLVSDDYAPDGAAAWLAPFGEEDREHATMAKVDATPSSLAEHLARRLDRPLLVTCCSSEEFRQWEDYHILPEDLKTRVE